MKPPKRSRLEASRSLGAAGLPHFAPPSGAFNFEAATAAVDRIRARHRDVTLGGVKIAGLIAKGRT
jgi:hypothetical protein